MNPISDPGYLIPPLVAAGVTITLLVIVLRGGKTSLARRMFCWFLGSVAASAFLVFAMRSSPDMYRAAGWEKGLFVAILLGFVFYYHFVLGYTNTKSKRKRLYAAYALAGVVVALAPGNLVLEGMSIEPYGYAPTPGPFGVVVVLASLFLQIDGIFTLVARYKASSSGEERNRLTYLIVAAPLLILGVSLDSFSPLPPIGIWMIFAFCVISSVVIVRYHLLDIRILIRKGLAYVLASVIIAVPYVVALYFLSRSAQNLAQQWWLNVIIILVLAIVLRPLYDWAQRRVDRLFYRDRYDYFRALEQLAREAQRIVDFRSLGQKVVELVNSALRTANVSLLLASQGSREFVCVAATGMDIPPNGIALNRENPLIKWMELQNRPISAQELEIHIELQTLSRSDQQSVEKLEAELYVPIKSRQGALYGVIVIGKRIGRQVYSQDEISLVSAVADQLSVNLENFWLYEETIRTAEALRESERRFRTMVEGAPSFMMIMDRSGTPNYVSPNCYKFTGYTQGELEGRVALWVSRDEVARFSETLKRAFQEKIWWSNLEYKATKKNRETWYASSSWQLMPDYGGEAEALIVQTVDVTERKRAEKALQESEERLRLTFESIIDGIAICSLGGEIIKANEAMENMFTGDVPEDLAGQTFLDFIAETDRQKATNILSKTLEAGNDRDVEFTLLKKDKTEFPAEMSIAVLRNETGRPSGYVIVVRDVTDRRQMEAEQAEMQQRAHLTSRLAMVGEMASGIAHEMNNPLTSVIGFSELLMRKDTTEDVRKNIERIHQGAQRVANIVARLLTFARQHKPERSYIDINEILQNTLSLRTYEMETNNIKLTTLLAPDLPHTMADPGQLQQVFLNIVINAEKEMRLAHGKGNLTVKTEARSSGICISFADDGPGIAEENIDKIFHPFFTTRDVGNGTGLGLSISHGIIKDHDGRISVHSRLGQGATFFIELPIRSEKEEQRIKEPQDRQKKQKKPARGTILAIDDEAAILDYLRQVLSNAGYETETAPDTQSARKLFMERDYDLILLDIKMPGRSGIELYEDLKATIPGLQNKVIVITGDISSDDTKAFLAATGVAYIAKPFDAVRLLGEIENGLARSRTKK